MTKFPHPLLIGSALLVLLLANAVQAAVSVQGVRVWRAPDHTKLVLDLSGPARHKIMLLSNPERLVLDLSDVQLRTSVHNIDLKDSPVKSVRSGIRNGVDLRLVLDVRGAVKPRSYLLPATDEFGHRLVVDMYDAKTSKPVVKKHAQTARSTKRDIIIAIDAGHGGEDSGAVGANRILEKNVVLQTARQLARLFDGTRGYKAVLIREDDYFVPLEERRNLARKANADLFLSIHADAFKRPAARGGSVFSLSPSGASSTFAKALAARENKADLIGGFKMPAQGDKDLHFVLVDLALTGSIEAGEQVGHKVLNAMKGVMTLHSNRLERANFSVLRSPDIPSLLIETGFISNPEEARKLNTATYRRQIAQSVFNGVSSYFEDLRPEGTYIAFRAAQPRQVSQHIIAPGDTLSGIAQRYKVSLQRLKSHNRLNGNAIRIGQKLNIPAS
ncbi:MAG: N-acetylmuramoyl-L-alanine amidase [Pseudomonadales bacterium]